MTNEKLRKQIEFVKEIDKMKNIFRQNLILSGDRRENDAEHSWHLAVTVVLLAEYSSEEIDVLKTVKMVLIHDLVEIDAGDTFCYDEEGYLDKAEREQKAAERIFSMLPEEQGKEIYDLWTEFEEVKTPEARFAACIDRFQPLILNYNTGGHTWKKPGVTSEKVYKRNKLLKDYAPELWTLACEMIEDAISRGLLKK